MSQLLSILKEAIRLKTGEIFKIKYNGGSQYGAVREIYPLQILNDDKYLLAKCISSNEDEPKTFIIDKMELCDISEPITYKPITKNEGKQKSRHEFKITFRIPQSLNVLSVTEKPDEELPLKGLTFVVTGTLKNFSRSEIKDFIQKNGGKVAAAVSNSTNFLIFGDFSGNKLDKAKKMSIKVINEDQFMSMIKSRR